MIKSLLAAYALLFFMPLAAHAALWAVTDHGQGWANADWSSAGLLPEASAHPEALIHVYAGRVGRWRGAFAHHSWVVVKEKRAARYTRFDKVAWGQPVKTDGWAADGRWFGHTPVLIGAVEGAAAERMIPKIRRAVATYPYNQAGGYSLWPGPNSNSFVAHVLASIPEARIALPPTAIGKDWRTDGRWLGPTMSGTGYQLSFGGLFGISIGRVEGFEVNILGLVVGIDLLRPAIKLPGFGRIGMAR